MAESNSYYYVKFIGIGAFADYYQATFFKTYLEQFGIETRISREHLHSIFGLNANSITGNVEVQVPEDKQELALEKMEVFFELNREHGGFDTCPECNSFITLKALDCPECGLMLV